MKPTHSDIAPMSSYPPPLTQLIEFFENLPEPERRENLIDLAQAVRYHAPMRGEVFDVSDERKDAECTDTVGIHLRIDPERRTHISVTLGPKVQTLTRALATLLCRGLSGSKPEEIQAIPPDFVPRIVGQELVRLRSQTVYYMLSRIKEAAGKVTH
jgi:cysteine desulfuration protein SufE